MRSPKARWKLGPDQSTPDQIQIIYRQEDNNFGRDPINAVFNIETGKLDFGDFDAAKESFQDTSFNGSAIRKTERDIVQFLDARPTAE